MNDFVTYQSFFEEEQVALFIDVLKENKISYIVETEPVILDHTIIGNDPDRKIHLKLNQSDFITADSLFEKVVTENLSSLPQDYYLYQFSNEELKEIFTKPDEWSKQDVVIAKGILAERNVFYTDEELAQLKNNRIKYLAKPENGLNIWVVVGYISSLLGGIFGIVLGYILFSSKKLLPDGGKVFLFNRNSQLHGKIIFILGIIFLILTLLGGPSFFSIANMI
jgi:hypothetical protein